MICPRCQTAQPDGLNFCGNCGQNLRSSGAGSTERPDPWLGRVVDGRYRVLEIIGRGGMGSVYRVEHTRMGKIAAMKVMHGILVGDRDLAARFRREAEAVSRLTHVHTVQVFDFGEQDGSMYLVMEFVRGESLGRVLRHEGPMPFARIGLIASQICESLSEAHEVGIIHRDIKPENILVTKTRDGRDFVKVLDFGLALVRGASEPEITRRDNLVGTPYYMSPEQIKGEDLDARSDLYSLGAVVYRALTGENPFTAATPLGVLNKHISEPPTPPRLKCPDLPPEAEQVVLRAMEKNRDKRFGSAEEMRGAIIRMLEVPSGAGTRTLDVEDSSYLPLLREDIEVFERKFKRQGKIRQLAAGVAVVALLVGVAWWQFQGNTVVFPSEEAEPNNEVSQATPAASGKPVAGTLGKRHSHEESDRDWYRIQVQQTDRVVLQAEVSAIPNMDIKLELYGMDTTKIAVADAAGLAHGELIANLGLARGSYFLLVREVWVTGRLPTENLSDAYQLTATWRPIAPEDEVEPNDQEGSAQSVAPGISLTGYLEDPDDVDHFRLDGPGGVLLGGEVTPPGDVDVVLEIVRPQPVAKAQGQMFGHFDAAGPGQMERFSSIPWPPDGKPPVVAVRRKPIVGGDPSRRAAPPGAKSPYRLRFFVE